MRQNQNANDAQMAVQLIGQRSFKANRTTNWLIAFAAIIVVILITSTCSVFFNIQAFSNLQDLKSIGTTTDVIFSNPSPEQLAQLEENDLIQKPLYVSYKVGRLIGNIGQSGLGIDLYAVDNWDTWSSPLVSDFEGHYPTEADEVMMSTWLLKRFGIEPIVGTEITLSIGWDDYDVVQEETFRLSGFYTDTSYIDTSSKQTVFLSTARLSEHQLPAEVCRIFFCLRQCSKKPESNRRTDWVDRSAEYQSSIRAANVHSQFGACIGCDTVFCDRWLFNHLQHQLNFRHKGCAVLRGVENAWDFS